MTSGPHGSDRPGPVARLLGSLANALIDLGLPTIREWLRDRLGPAADVDADHDRWIARASRPRSRSDRTARAARARSCNRRGHRARARWAPGDASSRIHRGARVRRGRRAIRFAPTSRSPPRLIPRRPHGSGVSSRSIALPGRHARARLPPNPMQGRARLFVTSREWRLDGGRLDGEIVRAHFRGAGVFDPSEKPRRARCCSCRGRCRRARLTLEQARVGAFLDAASGLVGKAIAIPRSCRSTLSSTAILSMELDRWRRGSSARRRRGAPGERPRHDRS